MIYVGNHALERFARVIERRHNHVRAEVFLNTPNDELDSPTTCNVSGVVSPHPVG